MAIKFLLTDDDSDDRELFSDAIKEVDATVDCDTAGEACVMLNMFEDPAYRKPDLIFLDINLPEMSGWECLKVLKQKELMSDIPVVMYSTSSHERDWLIARDLGAIGLITKPTDFNELKNILAKVVAAIRNNRIDEISGIASLARKV